ncbi:hypothetical protein GCM10027199_53090 [Amycolatopsis magusensis]
MRGPQPTQALGNLTDHAFLLTFATGIFLWCAGYRGIGREIRQIGNKELDFAVVQDISEKKLYVT